MSYVEKFQFAYENQKNRMEEKAKKYKESGLPQNPLNLYTMTASNLEILAVGEYVLNDDIDLMKNYYYNAALAQQKAMIHFDLNPNQKSAGCVSMLSYRELFYALISDCDDLVVRYAKLMGGRGNFDIKDTNQFTYNWGYALKYLVLGDDELALACVNKLKDNERTHYSNCLKSIIEKDEKHTALAIDECLKKHKSRISIKNTTQGLFSTTIVALAKLSNRRGVIIDIDDPIAPRKVIEKSVVKYELIDIVRLFYDEDGHALGNLCSD